MLSGWCHVRSFSGDVRRKTTPGIQRKNFRLSSCDCDFEIDFVYLHAFNFDHAARAFGVLMTSSSAESEPVITISDVTDASHWKGCKISEPNLRPQLSDLPYAHSAPKKRFCWGNALEIRENVISGVSDRPWVRTLQIFNPIVLEAVATFVILTSVRLMKSFLVHGGEADKHGRDDKKVEKTGEMLSVLGSFCGELFDKRIRATQIRMWRFECGAYDVG